MKIIVLWNSYSHLQSQTNQNSLQVRQPFYMSTLKLMSCACNWYQTSVRLLNICTVQHEYLYATDMQYRMWTIVRVKHGLSTISTNGIALEPLFLILVKYRLQNGYLLSFYESCSCSKKKAMMMEQLKLILQLSSPEKQYTLLGQFYQQDIHASLYCRFLTALQSYLQRTALFHNFLGLLLDSSEGLC